MSTRLWNIQLPARLGSEKTLCLWMRESGTRSGAPRRSAEAPSKESEPLEQHAVLNTQPEVTPLPDSEVKRNDEAPSRQPEEDLSRTLTDDIVVPSSPTETSEGVPDKDDEPVIVPQELPSITTRPLAASDATPAKEEPNVSLAPTPPPADPLPDSKPKVSQDKSAWLVTFESTLGFVERVSDVFPPLKSVVAGIKAVAETANDFFGNQEEFLKLSERVRLLDEILRDRSDSSLPQHVRDRRDGLKRAIEDLEKQLEVKTTRGKLKRAVFTKEDQQDIIRIIREINFAIEFAMVSFFLPNSTKATAEAQLKLDVSISNETLSFRAVAGIDWLKGRTIEESSKTQQDLSQIIQGITALTAAEQLKKLGNVAGYEFSIQNQRARCVAGSRVALISHLLAWAEDRSSAHAFWLNGMAGTGKTAVSETLCQQLSNRSLLGASFFCSLKVDELRDVYHIIPSLAKTLAGTYPAFRDALVGTLETLNKDPVRQLELSEQYDLLILQPAEVAFKNLDRNLVLCVDALDECKTIAALKEFLKWILSKKPAVSLKFFFTSRPEPDIKREVESSAHTSYHQTLRLHEIGKDIVSADIALYVSQELKKVPELWDEYGDNWPPQEVEKIVEQSDSLFIIAATMVRDICRETGDPVKRLQACGRAPKLTGVHELYGRILERATKDLEAPDVEDLRSCLSLLVVALRPLSLAEYAALLGCSACNIQTAFKMLHSVVQLPDKKDGNGPVSIYHASFADFLTYIQTAETSGGVKATPLWTVKRQEAHSLVFKQCLKLMNDPKQGVYFGVSSAVTSYRSNDDQPCTLSLRSDLAYTCTSWGNHALAALPLSENVQSTMQAFLVEKGLYWLEALSAEKKVGYSSILWELSREMTLEALKNLLVTIRDFAQMFTTPISHSTPHLYLSALPFYEAALGQFPWWSLNIPSIPAVHSTEGAKANQHRILVDVCKWSRPFTCVLSLAVSPDGSRLISGDDDGMVRMWNAQSGEPIWGNIAGHSEDVNSVAFSPDGSKVISGSDDSTICVWDAKSGQPLGISMEQHGGPVYSVAFSPDGSKIVSGSGDKTIRIWDALTGKALGDPIKGHTEAVCSVAFSPDELRIISGSNDNTIRVWDARNGKLVLGPLQGHTRAVLSVAVSPDGSKIVSGSDDKTIWVWDTHSGQDMFGPIKGPLGRVLSVAFSPNGSKIVSGSGDAKIRIWDAQTGQAVGRPMEGHSDWVRAVTFTPDGLKIISGSEDGTIQIWDLQGDHTAEDPGHCHSGSIASVAYSPDGSRIVSGSDDRTVWVWDAKTGQALVGPMEDLLKEVNSVAFSPDGTRIVSGSGDNTIRVWDAQGGSTVLGPLQNHSEWVLSVAFSPDGSLIASGSRDHTIQLWDAETGLHFLDPFKGHTDWVRSIGFSPCGTRLVSGSDDRTVRVWDVQSGQVILAPFIHDWGVNTAAFSPDGSKIISGSGNRSPFLFGSGASGQVIQVWDAHNGSLLLGPLKGHSNGILSVAFSPDGLKIASGSADKTICIWDAQSGELIDTLQGHSDSVFSVSFSPDGSRIVSGSRDKTIRVWIPSPDGLPNPSFLSHYPAFCLMMHYDGWIRNMSNDLLLWIPPQFRASLCIPPLERVISGASTRIELSQAVHHGPNWRRRVIVLLLNLSTLLIARPGVLSCLNRTRSAYGLTRDNCFPKARFPTFEFCELPIVTLAPQVLCFCYSDTTLALYYQPYLLPAHSSVKALRISPFHHTYILPIPRAIDDGVLYHGHIFFPVPRSTGKAALTPTAPMASSAEQDGRESSPTLAGTLDSTSPDPSIPAPSPSAALLLIYGRGRDTEPLRTRLGGH
ncbi:hypothetical protein NMY22_g14167 [Coprinellus aureogranulatus]|nr:hypothetical protein NMY22_g14167 [Coprinellus aureogranulatus]